jgi:large subunit ribosomal protein L14
MIQRETKILVLDNSGGRIVKCVSLKNSYKRVGAGFIIKGSLERLRKKRRSKSKVKRSKLYNLLILQTQSPLLRQNGKSYLFSKNCCIVIGKNNEPLATRVFAGVPKEARTQRKSKLFLMAPYVY